MSFGVGVFVLLMHKAGAEPALYPWPSTAAWLSIFVSASGNVTARQAPVRRAAPYKPHVLHALSVHTPMHSLHPNTWTYVGYEHYFTLQKKHWNGLMCEYQACAVRRLKTKKTRGDISLRDRSPPRGQWIKIIESIGIKKEKIQPHWSGCLMPTTLTAGSYTDRPRDTRRRGLNRRTQTLWL